MKKIFMTILLPILGLISGVAVEGRRAQKKANKIQQTSEKNRILFLVMNQWVQVKQDGKNLSAYFEKHGYGKIAIYGMSYMGETLINELKDTGIEVAYGIDRHADSLYGEVEVITLEGELEPVDAIIVTAITFFDEIKDTLSEKVDCPIVSLEDILYEV